MLVLFFWQVDMSETWDALKGAEYGWLVPAVAVYFVAVLFRAIRWHYLLQHMKSIPVGRLYPVVVVGYMANNLLPFRLGELVRSWHLGRREGVSKSAALATIIVERVLDGIVLIILALILWPFLPVNDLLGEFTDATGIPWGVLLAFVVIPFTVVMAIFVVAAVNPALAKRLAGRLALLAPEVIHIIPKGEIKLREPLQSMLAKFIDGLAALRSPKRTAAAVFFTFPIWFSEATLYYLIALGFDISFPFHVSVFIASISNLATSIPSSAGGVGPFEFATQVTLEGFDVVTEVATAYAIVVHAALLAPVTVLGLYYIWTHHISLRDLAQRPAAEYLETYEPSGAGGIKS